MGNVSDVVKRLEKPKIIKASNISKFTEDLSRFAPTVGFLISSGTSLNLFKAPNDNIKNTATSFDKSTLP